MALTTEKNGQIKKADAAQGNDLAGLLKRMEGEIARALPKHINPDRMARVALTALRTTPKLAQCSATSFAGSILACAQLGLEPNTPMGMAYLIPRNMSVKQPDGSFRKEMTCTLIIGYQGFLDIARRSGQVTGIYAYTVHEGDKFRVRLGLDPDIEHEPLAEDRRAVTYTHVYAVAKLKDGDPIFVVLQRAEVNARKDRSAAKDDGPWETDHLAMVRKTAVRALWAWLPKSVEMQRADTYDATADKGRPVLPEMDDSTARTLLAAGVAIPREPIDAEGETVDGETGEATPAKSEGTPFD
jgi:recombination protein RecT